MGGDVRGHTCCVTNLTRPLPKTRILQEGEMAAEVEMEEATKTGTAGGKKQKVCGTI